MPTRADCACRANHLFVGSCGHGTRLFSLYSIHPSPYAGSAHGTSPTTPAGILHHPLRLAQHHLRRPHAPRRNHLPTLPAAVANLRTILSHLVHALFSTGFPTFGE